jgi:hypothetical protein
MMTPPQVSWLFFKARATSIRRGGRKERATRKNSQPTAARRVALQMGRRLRRLRIDSDMRPPRALPAAHFERNDVTIICETVHSLTDRVGRYLFRLR